MLVFLILTGCAVRTAPTLFPMSLPEVTPPEHAEFVPADDECPDIAPFKPGHLAPYVIEGEATCRGQLLPELRTYELIVAEDLAAYWQPVAEACYVAREADRTHAQAWYDVTWQQQEEAQRDARVQRIVAGMAFVGGTALGLGLGAAYARVLP